jgi:hypothetical protein
MAFDPKDYAQGGILTLLLAIITALFAWRGSNKVKTDNSRANRESRFEENLQQRYEAAMARNSELQDELRRERDGKALLMRKARDDGKRIRNLLEMLSDEERKQAERWVQESGFAPFESDPIDPTRKGR